jgi:dihydrofolate reductase
MSKFIYYTATTINGYIAGKSDNLEWLFAVDSEKPDFTGFFDSVSVLIMGSNTYRWLMEKENIISKPDKWQTYFGNKPVYVFTNNLMQKPKNANIEFLCGDVSNHIEKFIHKAGSGDIWIQGGGDLAGQFFDCKILNEIHLSVAPVFLESGKFLLPRDIFSNDLKLLEAEKTGDFVFMKYKVLYED